MSFKVLKSYDENKAARKALQNMKASYWPNRPKLPFWKELLRLPPIEVGELNKSWDVYQTLIFLKEKELENELIVDLGAYASEVLCTLHLSNFKSLLGVDLNPKIKEMPFANIVKWQVSDMTKTHIRSETVSAAVAISSIEHGYSPESLLQEVSRILKPGGFFIGSTDYWQQKIDTSQSKMFGMSWNIFSEPEIYKFIDTAEKFGLKPSGRIELDCSDAKASIDCEDKLYTFLWFAFEKLRT